MFWAIASSIFVIYLYRKLNASPTTESGPADGIEAELAALNARIADLERKIGGDIAAGTKP